MPIPVEEACDIPPFLRIRHELRSTPLRPECKPCRSGRGPRYHCRPGTDKPTGQAEIQNGSRRPFRGADRKSVLTGSGHRPESWRPSVLSAGLNRLENSLDCAPVTRARPTTTSGAGNNAVELEEGVDAIGFDRGALLSDRVRGGAELGRGRAAEIPVRSELAETAAGELGAGWHHRHVRRP